MWEGNNLGSSKPQSGNCGKVNEKGVKPGRDHAYHIKIVVINSLLILDLLDQSRGFEAGVSK